MTPQPDSLTQQIDDVISEAREDAYQAGGNDTNMDLRDYTSEIIALLESTVQSAAPEPLKESEYGLNMACDHNPPSDTTRTNLYRKGYNQGVQDTVAAILAKLKGQQS